MVLHPLLRHILRQDLGCCWKNPRPKMANRWLVAWLPVLVLACYLLTKGK